MLSSLRDWFSTYAMSISTPRMVFARLVGFLESVIDSFTGHHFSLPLLFLVDRVIQGLTLVEDRDLTLSIFTHSDWCFAHGITGTRSLDLVNHLLVLQGQVLGEDALLLLGEEQR